MVARIKDREYADRRLTAFPGGFVQQPVLKGKRIHDDGEVRLPCAIICKVENGKITRLDEYFDSAHVEIGRAHVCTPVTNAHLVCRPLPAHKSETTLRKAQ